ncbi:MAG: lytic murein transglycosylase B [Sutterellaceae bacterium]|nr:lytic murein transglycosylase B [Burkholderiaceae bacterium]MCX7901421.1 lytic murein transglycosylase B [Burkholderiaceae bacterium]MDW8429700.1 lytic murein transglycosylase B [Sutterellaceae bacterium]
MSAARRALLTALGAWPLAGRAQDGGYLQRAEVQAFVAALVAAHGLPRGWVERVLAAGRYSVAAERLSKPAHAPAGRNWLAYRARHVDAQRVREGAAFFRAQRAWLAAARARFGVPEEIVTAILGVETQFGRVLGEHRTLDVLLTLAFDYTRRADFYREELTHFLLLCHERQLDPLALRGSYAGALGLPQFMPSSMRAFALDFDGDGRVDLAANAADAIGSVGNYLAACGWQPDLPVVLPARADRGVLEILGRGIRAVYRWRDVAALGVAIDGALDDEARVLLIDLPYLTDDGAAGVQWRIGTVNFAALLHYNRSYFYAAAVVELAQAIRARVLA